jgi:hypothetical protein
MRRPARSCDRAFRPVFLVLAYAAAATGAPLHRHPEDSAVAIPRNAEIIPEEKGGWNLVVYSPLNDLLSTEAAYRLEVRVDSAADARWRVFIQDFMKRDVEKKGQLLVPLSVQDLPPGTYQLTLTILDAHPGLNR